MKFFFLHSTSLFRALSSQIFLLKNVDFIHCGWKCCIDSQLALSWGFLITVRSSFPVNYSLKKPLKKSCLNERCNMTIVLVFLLWVISNHVIGVFFNQNIYHVIGNHVRWGIAHCMHINIKNVTNWGSSDYMDIIYFKIWTVKIFKNLSK